jgi:hypothetical protein
MKIKTVNVDRISWIHFYAFRFQTHFLNHRFEFKALKAQISVLWWSRKNTFWSFRNKIKYKNKEI